MKTLVTLVLDKSSSMKRLHKATIEAVNAYIDAIKIGDGADETLFSLVQFCSASTVKTCVRTPIAAAPSLSEDNYRLGGMTPLVDAACKTILAVAESLKSAPELNDGSGTPKVIVAIQTDGEENSSTEYTFKDLNAMIKDKTSQGWEFVFLGCGLDAYASASSMGISASSTVSYAASDSATKSAFGSLAANTRAFRSGASASVSFSEADKVAAGDIYDPARAAPAPELVAATRQKPLAAAAVDDFAL